MGRPLALSYHWQPAVLFASVGAVVLVGALARSSATGRGAVIALVVVLWAGFLALVWVRTRAHLEVDGSRLTVRRFRGKHTVRGDQLLRVQQVLTPSGPSYRLVARTDDGRVRRYVAPTALLQTGHTTLFTWILAHAPSAELDRGATRTLDQLRVRGLVA